MISIDDGNKTSEVTQDSCFRLEDCLSCSLSVSADERGASMHAGVSYSRRSQGLRLPAITPCPLPLLLRHDCVKVCLANGAASLSRYTTGDLYSSKQDTESYTSKP